MNLTYEIEIKLPRNRYKYLEVEFEAEPTIENDSFSYAGTHCTHGRSGTYKMPDYVVVEDIIWDREKHSEKENKIIEVFISDRENFLKVADLFCYQYQKEKEADRDYDFD